MIPSTLPLCLALVALLGTARPAAAQGVITVLSSNGIRAVLTELTPRFEQTAGERLSVTFSVAADLKRRIEGGAAFDVAILTPAAIDDLIVTGAIVRASRASLARSGMALAVPAGRPKPDIRTVPALTRALREAPSIAFAKEGAGGVFFSALLPTLGLADALSATLRPLATGTDVSASLGRGEAALGLLPLSELISAPGVDVVGPFPADIQGYAVMVAGIGTRAANVAGARKLVAFLEGAEATAVLPTHGMERVP